MQSKASGLIVFHRIAVDRTEDLITRWRHPVAVPDVVTLLGHIQTPLQEDEKVPISQEDFDYLVQKFELTAHNISLKAENVSKLFRVSDDEEARPIVTRFMYNLDLITWQYLSETEESFIYSWDVNISSIIRTILLDGTSIRNGNHNPNTALKRPDYGFLINHHCLFRGEERGPNSTENPEIELVAKLGDFSYQPLKFILGLSHFVSYHTNSYFFVSRVLRYWKPDQLRCNNPTVNY